MQDIVVLKFGSSVLRTAADLPAAVHEIYRWYREGSRVLAVVSAIGETTEQLLHQAREFSATPEPRATARLLATGEQTSAALLGIALDRVGVPCRVLDPRDIGLTVAGGPLDSEAIGVDAQRLRMALDQCPVVVLPGFFGHAPDGSLHLLGRGGSDLSAVFLACSLRAQRCRLLKDVDGVYEFDPARASSPPRRYTRLGYADALRVAGSLIQTKAVAFLASCGMTAEVAALGAPHESLVHSGPTVRAAIRPPQPPSRVLLLGLGTVGLGVYRRLLAVPQLFEPLGALVRHRGKHEAAGVPVKLLHSSEDAVLASQPDIVVDALPGGRVSQRLVGDFLSRGVDVVTANKALIADHGAALMKARHKGGSLLRFSAAVGGSAPMIEAVCMAARRGPVQAIAGVLNGTCNYLLERCAQGASFEETLADAQARGFAEADPTEDLSGRDAERKLRILAEHAFGEPLLEVATEAFTVEQGHAAREASRRGSSLRQVASVRRDRGRLSGRIAFEVLEREHPLALVSGEWNALVVTHSDGRSLKVVGRGAGRWPTSEAVVADLLEVRRARQSSNRTP